MSKVTLIIAIVFSFWLGCTVDTDDNIIYNVGDSATTDSSEVGGVDDVVSVDMTASDQNGTENDSNLLDDTASADGTEDTETADEQTGDLAASDLTGDGQATTDGSAQLDVEDDGAGDAAQSEDGVSLDEGDGQTD